MTFLETITAVSWPVKRMNPAFNFICSISPRESTDLKNSLMKVLSVSFVQLGNF